MRFNINLIISGSAFWCLFLFSQILNSQTYSFKNYGAEYKIPSGVVYTLNQSDDGFLWAGTSNGIARFDGFNFFPVQYPDSLNSRYPTVSHKTKDGNLWFGCNDGSVFIARGNNLINVPLSNSNSISDILEGPDDLIYVIPQGRAIFTINPRNPDEINKYSFSINPVMFSASFTYSGKLLIGTQENLLICNLKKDSILVAGVIEGFDNSNVNAIRQTQDSTVFVIGTADNGLFKLRLSDKENILTRFKDHQEWESLNIQSISEDSGHNIWVATKSSGAIQFHFGDNYETVKSVRQFDTNSGLAANNVFLVFQDYEGNYWISFNGQGISMLSSYAFGYYRPGKTSVENNILFIKDFKDKYILGTPSGFHLFDPVRGKSVSFTELTNQVGKAEISSYYLDNDDNLWIGTSGNGLFVRNSSGSIRLFYRSGDSGTDDIRDIEINNQDIWLATTFGVIVLDRNTREMKKRFDIDNGLPHNSINKIFVSHEGTVYIGTESDRLCAVDKDYKLSMGKSVMSGSIINKINSFSESTNGVIWVATKGNGIFECFRDSVSAITRSNDLMSNYCYSILADSEHYIWTGHERGFSRFNPSTGTMSIFGTDFEKIGVCNPEGMFESSDKKIFIGTTDGFIIYDRQNDRKINVPPFNNINYVYINDELKPYQSSYTIPYSKKNVIKVYYSGINFSAPEKVYYSTYLQNYDDDWTKMNSSREVSYNLRDGKYKFSLISVNQHGLSQEKSVTFNIIITPPVWRKWWFILSSLAVVSAIVILIIRERDKSQKKIQAYLEKELEARTSVVMKQKGEIELQNIEITDSINYAKRIQSSILPDINKLKETFRDAFILFHPRDIVSGDFYWFDKLEEDKFILVCADSTGHGVPGAFMSMIGSTLLQDIVTRQRISKPSVILSLLDKQIFSTLNQNVELGVSNDGMDMVVCEFNIRTRYIRFASAMRPIIIVIDSEPYYIKGNRLSVGGESVMEKYFDDQEYYLNEGDTVYLFSDGLPDQFGGIDGKKLKIARLKRLMEQVSKLPMNEQKEAISKFYFDWKGAYDQVDDILLIGVKV
jgi:ligand-binding sensor domain-containing protein/serine phosphatase RsbU (regulator of sigma subunit)